jgi:hypothetical protein
MEPRDGRVVVMEASAATPRSVCRAKSAYGTQLAAVLAARRIARKDDADLGAGQVLAVFACPHGEHWHVGRGMEIGAAS